MKPLKKLSTNFLTIMIWTGPETKMQEDLLVPYQGCPSLSPSLNKNPSHVLALSFNLFAKQFIIQQNHHHRRSFTRLINKYITASYDHNSQLHPGVPGPRDVPLGQVGDVPGGDHAHLHGGGGPLHPV